MARQIVADWSQELRLERLLPSLITGLVSGSLDIMVQISFAMLIFSGVLSEYVGVGIGLTLFAGLAVGLVVALTSSLPGMVAVPQDSPAAILAVVATGIAAAMPAAASPESLASTVIVAIALTSLLSGIFFLMLGWLKQGGLVRFIPYPVIGGFLAGTGWLLAQGSISVMADVSPRLADLPLLVQGDTWLRWLPGLVFAVLLLLVLRRYSHFLVMPTMLIGAMVLFYVALAWAGISLDQARAQGWLLGPFPEGALWRPLTPAVLSQVYWPAIVGQAGNVGTILIVSVVSLLLNASGVELVARQDVDLNRELKAAGLGNILAGLGGGPPGYQALSASALSYRTGTPSRLVGVTMALMCGLLLVVGTSVLSYFPKVLLGSLLLFLGLSFLVEWLYDGWFKLSKGDYAIVLLILVTMNLLGVLAGVGLGLALAMVLFIVDYSRLGAVRHEMSGTHLQSNVERPRLYQRLLRKKGDWLYILQLQGFLFFGTAHGLLDRVRARLAAADRANLRFVVLDFRRVSGMDASAVMSFVKMDQLAEAQKFALVFTDLSPQMEQRLAKELPSARRGDGWYTFADLDHGVEWCEEQMISTFESVGLTARKPKSIMRQLEEFLSRSPRFAGWQAYLSSVEKPPEEPDTLHSALPFMERRTVEAGQVLIHQGEPAPGLYFIESGRVTIQVKAGDRRFARLRTQEAGTIVGESGLYLGQAAPASVVVEQPGVVYHLSAENLDRLEAEQPELAASLHKFLARRLSERLADTTWAWQALLD